MRGRLILPIILILSFVSLQGAFAADKIVTISGKVRNSKNKRTIENVSLSVPGTNIATVTNADGGFSLKVPAEATARGIKAEQIGFQSRLIRWEEIKGNTRNLNILLEPTGKVKVLKEVVVLGGDPKKIVEQALMKIPENYSDKDNLFSGFYRETVQKGSRFISISEAMVDVLKKPYKLRNTYGDKVSISKGRKLLSPKLSDTLAVKISGGPLMPVMLDVVKNGDHLFNLNEMDYFEFKMKNGAMIDDRVHYAISFEPKAKLHYPLYGGVLYIDGETLAISRVEFEMDMSDRGKVTRTILQKKPAGLHFKPQEVSGVVTYKLVDGKSYINYIASKIRFKCDWKRRLFSSGYTSISEIVMVDRNDSPEKNLKFADTFRASKVFSDIAGNYWEEGFWDDYNIIEPTESLEEAVTKLKKR